MNINRRWIENDGKDNVTESIVLKATFMFESDDVHSHSFKFDNNNNDLNEEKKNWNRTLIYR